MATAVSEWNCSITEAAERAAVCCGFNAEVVRRWASVFLSHPHLCLVQDLTDECITDILATRRGHHDNHDASLLQDEHFCREARAYVQKHACRKGEPNLTCKMFTEWVQAEHATCISEATARRWLSKLGFSRVHHQKGVYFDGHERNDVVDYRNEFLQKIYELDKISITCDGNTPELNNGESLLSV